MKKAKHLINTSYAYRQEAKDFKERMEMAGWTCEMHQSLKDGVPLWVVECKRENMPSQRVSRIK